MSSPSGPPIAKQRRLLPQVVMAVAVVGATAWSLLTTQYQFAKGDDGWQAPMVVHLRDPALLNHDPLITEIGARYKSALFYLLAWLAGLLGLEEAYTLVFVLTRFLTLAAYYHVARVTTRSRAVGLVAVLLLTGYGYYSFGTYLGGTPLLEEKLVPRSPALPFAFMALAACIQRRHGSVAGWLTATIAIHPVTGVNVLGLYVVYTVLSVPRVAWRPFMTALGVVGAILGVTALWTGQLGNSSSDLFVDGEWREIVAATVGPWVFIQQDTAWALPQFPTALAVGGLSVLVAGGRWLRRVYFRLLTGAVLAGVIHFFGVDRMGLHPLLEACPERATLGVTAFAGIGLAVLIVRTFPRTSEVGRLILSLLFAAIVFRADPRGTVFLFLASLIVAAPAATRSAVIVGGLTLLGFTATLGVHPFRAGPFQWESLNGLQGFGGLATRGSSDLDLKEAQLWIREHSDKEDTILPPLVHARGWQIYSQRSCSFNSSLHTYTHLSRDFAHRYRVLAERLQSLREGQQVDPVALFNYAREIKARWIAVDSRDTPMGSGAPKPAFTSGLYQVYRVVP
jgi:hypothetical protein